MIPKIRKFRKVSTFNKMHYQSSIIVKAFMSVLLMMSVIQVSAKPFIGADIGLSTLDPDANNSGFTIKEDQGTGFNVHAGFVFGAKLAAELRYFDLGSAELENPDTGATAQVDYSGFGLSGAYYYPKYFEHWTVYTRFGISALTTSANVPVEKDSDISPWFGLGTQLHIGGGMLLHLQYDSYSEDAQQLSLGISKFWGGGKEVEKIEEASIIDEEAELDLYTTNNKPFALNPIAGAEENQSPNTDVSALRSELGLKDDSNELGSEFGTELESDLLTKALDETLNTKGDIDDEKPKGVFHKSNAIASLYFTIGSAELTPDSLEDLQRIQKVYTDNKSTQNVIFVGHTCDIGHDGNNQQLSLIRAAAAQQHLVSLGVDPEKTKATAFGAKNPKFINNSEENRRENRRVDVFYQVPSLLERLHGLQ